MATKQKHYRIISDPSWQVQSKYKGEWRTCFYCGSEESAKRCVEDLEKRHAEWLKMTPKQRMLSILR